MQRAGLPRLPGQSTPLVALKRVPGLGPCVLVMAGREAPLDLRDVPTLLDGLGDGTLSKDVVVALERQLCGEGPVPSGEAARLLQDHRCFRLLLHSFELLGAEKAVSLSILRWVQGDLVGVWGLRSRCVSAGGDAGGTWCMFVGPGGADLLHQGQVHPSTYAAADWGVLGHRAMWGQSSTCLGAGGDMRGQCSTCLGAGGVSEVPGEPWLPVPVGCRPSRWAASGTAVCVPWPERAPSIIQDPEQVLGRLPGG